MNNKNSLDWKGVMPAITTWFDKDTNIDHVAMARHAQWMADAGCTAMVAPGSLGEGATLTNAEKAAIWANLVQNTNVPIVAAIASLSTADAIAQAKAAQNAGCEGLMVLPPYVYKGDWREMKAHVSAVMRATPLSCMLYNNPIAYGTDFTPSQIQELANDIPNFASVKESSADVRRVPAIRELVGDRLVMCMGVDDAIVEGTSVGVVGWVAGLVNAFPKESVDLFEAATKGDYAKLWSLYKWFLPLLRLDTVGNFVQLIKLTQQEVGMGNETVRAPRLPIVGAERERTLAVIHHALATRPS
jgi:4-hydroxy-tetrahydrodipicolinate synthase